jgi:hypothetical protein
MAAGVHDFARPVVHFKPLLNDSGNEMNDCILMREWQFMRGLLQ